MDCWDTEYLDLWMHQLQDPSLKCWTRQESLLACMMQENCIAKVLWSSAHTVVQMMRKIWFRTEEPSEVALEGSPLR